MLQWWEMKCKSDRGKDEREKLEQLQGSEIEEEDHNKRKK